MELSITGEIAFIKRASSGICKAVARIFADAGATVIIHYNKNSRIASEVPGSLAD